MPASLIVRFEGCALFTLAPGIFPAPRCSPSPARSRAAGGRLLRPWLPWLPRADRCFPMRSCVCAWYVSPRQVRLLLRGVHGGAAPVPMLRHLPRPEASLQCAPHRFLMTARGVGDSSQSHDARATQAGLVHRTPHPAPRTPHPTCRGGTCHNRVFPPSVHPGDGAGHRPAARLPTLSSPPSPKYQIHGLLFSFGLFALGRG